MHRRSKSADRYSAGRITVDRYSSDTTATEPRISPSTTHDGYDASSVHHSQQGHVPQDSVSPRFWQSRGNQQQQQQQQQQSPRWTGSHNRQDYDQPMDLRNLQSSNIHASKDAIIGEMQIKLDIAAAQLITEEMKMKDTMEQFESERRTWREKIRAMERERQAYKSKLDEMQWQFESVLRVTQQESSSKMQYQEEMEELRCEIVRLHEAFREEKNMLIAEQNSIRSQYEKELQYVESRLDQDNEHKFKDLIQSLEQKNNAQLKELKASYEAQHQQLTQLVQKAESEKSSLQDDLNQGKKELEEMKQEYNKAREEIQHLSRDFHDLAEEAERLEKELESVSEDRDELLRQRSPQGRRSIHETNADDDTLVREKLLREKDKRIAELESQIQRLHKENRYTQTSLDDQMHSGASNDNIDPNQQLLSMKKERDELKTCLVEAMERVEQLEKVKQNANRSTVDMEQLNVSRKSVLLLIEWIEKRLHNALQHDRVPQAAPDDERDLEDMDALLNDPQMLSLFDHVKAIFDDKVSLETKLRLLSRELEGDDETKIDLSDPLDKENESDIRVRRLKASLASSRKTVALKDEANAELRSTLKEAVDLIKPMKEQVARNDEEKRQLQAELKDATERISALDRELKMARMKMEKLGQQDSNSFESENGDIDTDALLAQLQLKDDSLTDLHVEVAQLRDQIERLDLSTDTNDKNLRHQKGRGLQDVDQMKDDLIKYQIAERTLKGLLQHTTSLLNAQLLKKTSTNSDSSNDAVTNIQKDLDKAKARIVDLTNEISKLRDDLSVSQQNEKKLTVSLNEAVDLLKPLQTQIEKAEKDKKDLQIRLSEAQSTLEVRNLGHDIDYVTGRTNKGEYEKTIDQLNQYVGELEAEVTKLEGKVLVLNESSMKDDKRIRLLEAEITDLRGKYESTRIMLDDVTETNRSLLNDLRQSEAEELEVIEEFSEAQDMLRVAQEEIENAKFVASSLISKMDEINFRDNASSASARSTASGKMRTLTACFHALEEQVRLAAERNMALENQLSIKNRLISDMMGKRR